MAYDFNNTYAVDPWDVLDQDERPWYDGTLREVYARQAVYSPHVTMQVDVNAHRSRTITFNDLIPPRPNISPIGNRAMNASRLFMDSFQKQLTTERYGNGMSLHKESQMFNYWHRNGDFGLIPILEQALGQAIVDHFDLLARNAFFTNPYAMFGLGDGSSFADVNNTTHKMNTDLLDAIWLGMEDRRVPWAAYAQTLSEAGEIFCITSPGAIYDLKREEVADSKLNFVNAHAYAHDNVLVTGEEGSYRGIRFVKNGLAVLWNCGTIDHQAAITHRVKPGDGAPDPETTAVDNVRYVGQRGATHYIEVDDASGFTAGQKVTVHKLRHSDATNPRGVTDGGISGGGGVKYDDPMAQDIVIHSVDYDNNRILFKEPYMMVDHETSDELTRGLETDLGGGVYGYVTLARNIHTALFFHSAYSNGVAAGVTKPVELYFPPATDDYLSMYRITYDFWAKYQLWEPQVFEVAFISGANKDRGAVYRR